MSFNVCELVHEHDRVEIFAWKQDVCHKTWKLGDDTLHTDTSLYVNICTRVWPCKSERCVKLCLFFTVNTPHSPYWSNNVLKHGFICYREGFVSLKVVWLYFVSGTSMGNYVTNMVSCV